MTMAKVDLAVERVDYVVKVGGKVRGYVMRDFVAASEGTIRYYAVVIHPDGSPEILRPGFSGPDGEDCRARAVAALADWKG
jgi:hypothetical protein